MLNPNPYMLLYIAIGDAAAIPVEYTDRSKHEELYLETLRFKGFCQHPKYPLGKSLYSDDAEMSLAGALMIIENDPPYTEDMFADYVVRQFIYGGMRKGYSPGFQMILEKSANGRELRKNLIPNSNKNGAAMRAVVYGVFPTIEQVLEVATMQARLTHNTPEGLFSSRAIALMSHFAMYTHTPFHCFIGDYMRENLPAEDIEMFGHVFTDGWEGRVKDTDKWSVAINTVHAVVELLIDNEHFTLRDMLTEVIQLGGDTDTVAAIALGIAGIRTNPFHTGLPPYMFVDLENGDPKTGAKYLLDVGRRLMDKFNK